MFKNTDILELGSGVGLSSLIAGMYAKSVLCTDIDLGGILALIERNVKRNSRLHKENISVMELNFCDKEWSSELNAKLKNVEYIFAADLIYDDDLTELFTLALERLLLSLSKLKTIYIALEQRFVFTVLDLDTTAPCYDYFLKCFQRLQQRHPEKSWRLQPISIDFPQFFQYERVRELVLLQLTSN
jgi:methyltransferase-like protein 22